MQSTRWQLACWLVGWLGGSHCWAHRLLLPARLLTLLAPAAFFRLEGQQANWVLERSGRSSFLQNKVRGAGQVCVCVCRWEGS